MLDSSYDLRLFNDHERQQVCSVLRPILLETFCFIYIKHTQNCLNVDIFHSYIHGFQCAIFITSETFCYKDKL